MLKIKVPAKLEYLHSVNQFIGTALPKNFMSIQTQVELALEELLVNIFSYAYTDEQKDEAKNGEAEVSCHMVNFDGVDCFYVQVKDWGKAFNPFLNAPEPDISLNADDRPIGGLGVLLIKSITTHYAYSYVNESNCIQLYFALST